MMENLVGMGVRRRQRKAVIPGLRGWSQGLAKEGEIASKVPCLMTEIERVNGCRARFGR